MVKSLQDTTSFQEQALAYHEYPTPGKLGTEITKPVATQHDLTLAYSPGVAEPVKEIASAEENSFRYTNRGNLVAVITNGTAVLGLGNVGALASKPVMEGKGVLFKKLAGIDVFDIEVDAADPNEFIQTVKNIAPTFGGINLEDISAPSCFTIEEELRHALDIPVFHDDQHGTAITVAAALLNALDVQGKRLDKSKVVCVGAGAAGIASMRLLRSLGLPKDNLLMVDSKGVLNQTRQDLNKHKAEFVTHTACVTLADALVGADVFIGVSQANLLTPDMLLSMGPKPIVFALANPDPEINPAVAHSIRSDLVIATGRSDYPNQVNNVVCFPYIFRGALDVRAYQITPEMVVAATHAIRSLVAEAIPAEVRTVYPTLTEGGLRKDYILPKPNDPRLRDHVSAAVAKAALAAGVARLPYPQHYPK